MIFRVREPAASLRPFIETFWYHEGFATPHSMERLLPDGAIELIIDLTETPKWWTKGENRSQRFVQQSWISGQHRRYIVIESAKNSCMIGAHFRPGGANPFLDLPLSELNDSVVEMELIWHGAIHELRERLLASPSVDERFRLLEQALLCRAAGRLEPDRSLVYALGRLTNAPATIRGLADEIGVTQKRLVRTFQERVGLKPKTLARIFRFQSVIRKLDLDSRVSWAFIAQDAGYFDQSHFIRDFQSLSGLNPSRYLVDKGEYLNFLPIH